MRFLRIASVLLLAYPAFAATYYVATSGDDSADGSVETPFRTLARGVTAARAGDTVIVRSGRYGSEGSVSGGDSSQIQRSPVRLNWSGTPLAPITIRSDVKWGAILDCELKCDAYIDVFNASYVTIQDFDITRGYKEGIHSNDAAHHITLRGNRIHHIANRVSGSRYGLDGMYTNPNCHDFVIDGNLFHDIGRTNPSILDHGLYLRGRNFVVTNNIFYNIDSGWAIQMAAGLANVLVANNTFATQHPSRNGQIMLWNDQSNLSIFNNIFYQPRRLAITRHESSVSRCVIEHNLIYGGEIISDGTGCLLDSNLTGRDPKFVDAPGGDYRLMPGSPAISAGIPADEIRVDFDGQGREPDGPVDAGAYRFRPRSKVPRARPR